MTDPKNKKKPIPTGLKNHLLGNIPDTPGDAAREMRKMLRWGKPFEDFIFLSPHIRITLVLAIRWLEEFHYKNQIEKAKRRKESKD